MLMKQNSAEEGCQKVGEIDPRSQFRQHVMSSFVENQSYTRSFFCNYNLGLHARILAEKLLLKCYYG